MEPLEPPIGQPRSPLREKSVPGIGGHTERADAARNRRLLLDAAAGLVAECGAEQMSMDDVAERAGVGKGTLFRRFGSRAGLLRALLDEDESAMQQAFMFGPAPLGPGAPPVERIVAFGLARLAMLETHGDILLAAAEAARGQRYAHPAHALHRQHLSMLIRAAHADRAPDAPAPDPELLAESLLCTLDPGLVHFQRTQQGRGLDQLSAHWEALVRRTLA